MNSTNSKMPLDGAQGSATSQIPHPKAGRRYLIRECSICGDGHKKFFTATCGHVYCLSCLPQHIKHAIKQESTFPVACCGTEIAYDQVKHKLPPHVRLLFAAAVEEYSTPAAQRLYCAQGCGAFLGQVADSQVVQCTSCGEFTCAACRGVKHDGPCKIEDNNVMADLARAQNWQKCGGCKAMVELSYGCNHITCRCGFEFCYECGAKWKTCSCTQWTGANLRVVLAAQENGQPIPRVCVRHDWYAVPGRRRCDTCGRRRDQYRCRDCPAITCRECRDRAGNYGIWWA